MSKYEECPDCGDMVDTESPTVPSHVCADKECEDCEDCEARIAAWGLERERLKLMTDHAQWFMAEQECARLRVVAQAAMALRIHQNADPEAKRTGEWSLRARALGRELDDALVAARVKA